MGPGLGRARAAVSPLPSLDLPLVLPCCHSQGSLHLLSTNCELGLYKVLPSFVSFNPHNHYKKQVLILCHFHGSGYLSACQVAPMFHGRAGLRPRSLWPQSHPPPDNFCGVRLPHSAPLSLPSLKAPLRANLTCASPSCRQGDTCSPDPCQNQHHQEHGSGLQLSWPSLEGTEAC